MFHLGFELPAPPVLDSGTEELTPYETEIVTKQIRKNSEVVESYVKRIDLFVNAEKYPKDEPFIKKLRERMFLLMEENDTFRRLLWQDQQAKQTRAPLPV